MNKFLNGFLNICLIVFIILLVLNQLYIIDFSLNLRNIFIYLTFIIILLAIFSGAVAVRKNQIKTLIKIKEVYEKDNDRKEEIVSNLIQYNSKSTTKNEVSQ